VAHQTITVQALARIWLPAAFEPIAIDAGDSKVDYDKDSSTLIVDKQSDTSDGMSYTVTSRVPTWTDDQLRTASDHVPKDVAKRYLELPDDFSPRIVDEAQRLTQGAKGPYDKAMAMEDYLKTFTYSLQVQRGHSTDVLEDFLFVNKRGYCEQFAGAFAAMARAVHIPSRVVVGFTKGIQDPNERTLFRVNGEHAHAWVELWLDKFGWVTFDPTPGRAPPEAQNWLGVDEAQDTTGGDGSVATTVPGSVPGNGSPGTRPNGPLDNGGQIETSAQANNAGNKGGGDNQLVDTLVTGALLVAVAGLVYLLLVPVVLVGQQHLRRRRARAPGDRVDLAWAETNEQLALAGLVLAPSLTVSERAARMRLAFPAVVPSINVLTTSIERVTYGEVVPTAEEATEVVAASTEIKTVAARGRPWRRRVLAYLDVRRLLPEADQTRRTAHGKQRSRG
jgi:transglutaminase-like putative cysteine protease